MRKDRKNGFYLFIIIIIIIIVGVKLSWHYVLEGNKNDNVWLLLNGNKYFAFLINKNNMFTCEKKKREREKKNMYVWFTTNPRRRRHLKS